VRAWQTATEHESAAIANVEIFYNDKLAYSREISYPMLYGEPCLALQVYTMSQSPQNISQEFREVMEKFALMCIPTLKQQAKIHWPK
jgi:hypothetical protein